MLFRIWYIKGEGGNGKMFRENLKRLLTERNVRPSALAAGTGLPTSTIDSMLKTVNEKNIKVDNVIKIAEFFGVSVEWLYGKDEVGQKSEEMELLRLFNELNEEGQENALGLLNDMVAGGRYKKIDTSELLQKEGS
ncbi:helix-turn-helix transcriptional regulator [uncultured Rikenella sp.]|jgi:transcriptional regulator with XRE-family HTH domain|uniref:helix-turn-helix domain-containing protein n=1 Tax=uncultured Rikenella sp. TaxID=368003 RepID=UPI002608F4F2|nr:helix-turn-helix transcriptional regulator [uncultured Rikenella sp.]